VCRRFTPGLGNVLVSCRKVGNRLKPEQGRRGCVLFERDCKTRRDAKGLAVDGLDVDCQDLGRLVRLLGAVKTGGLPLEIQVALLVPCILVEVGDARVGARPGCEVTVPLLWKVYSIQGNVR